jgi:hypothetical protein
MLFTTFSYKKNTINRVKLSTTVPVGIPGKWTLKFDDEFNGNSLDSASWWPNWFGSSRMAPSQPVNAADSAAYDPAQVTVSRGYMNISLVKKPITVNGKTYPYRTGLVYTNSYPPLHQFTFGRLRQEFICRQHPMEVLLTGHPGGLMGKTGRRMGRWISWRAFQDRYVITFIALQPVAVVAQLATLRAGTPTVPAGPMV